MKQSTKVWLAKHAALLLICIGVIGLACSALLYLNQAKPSQHSQGIHIAAAPSSAKPSQTSIIKYTVAPTLPKYIAIPAINVSISRVKQLGLQKDNQLATPDNIFDAGWYKASAKPGQNGAMFIYGHVSSWSAKGIFYNLKKLKPGDEITITRGDNKVFHYKVVSTKTYPYNDVDMGRVLSPVDSSKPGLNLMTCTGKIIKGTSEFDQRLVVYTKLSN